MEEFQKDLFYSADELILPGAVYVPLGATIADTEYLVGVMLGFDPKKGFCHLHQRVSQGENDALQGETKGDFERVYSGPIKAMSVQKLFSVERSNIATTMYDECPSPNNRRIKRLCKFAPVALTIRRYHKAEVFVELEERARSWPRWKFLVKKKEDYRRRLLVENGQEVSVLKDRFSDRPVSLDEFFGGLYCN